MKAIVMCGRFRLKSACVVFTTMLAAPLGSFGNDAMAGATRRACNGLECGSKHAREQVNKPSTSKKEKQGGCESLSYLRLDLRQHQHFHKVQQKSWISVLCKVADRQPLGSVFDRFDH